MRRKDREVVDKEAILQIIDKCDLVRIGMVDNNVPYVVPLNFGILDRKEKVTIVFHSATAGRKVAVLAKNPQVCFEMDSSFKILKGETSCQWSAEYESVIGWGTVEFIKEEEEKKSAMDAIMLKYGFKGMPVYNSKMLEKTLLMKLTVESMTGKSNIKTKE